MASLCMTSQIIRAAQNHHGSPTSLDLPTKLNNCEIEALATIRTLTKLDLHDRGIRDMGVQILTQMPSLTFLDLGLNKDITLNGIEALIPMSSLTSLSLREMKAGDDMAMTLTKIKSLRILDLSHNTITIKGLDALTKGSLTSLNLSDNWISGKKIKALSRIQSSTLTFLDLSSNELDEGVDALAVCPLSSLTSLVLVDNYVDDEGAAMLAQRKTLKTLILDYNEITVDGARELAHSALRTLSLRGNQLGDEGVAVLAKMPFLTSLDVSHNGVGEKGALKVAQSSSIRKLEMCYGQWDEDWLGMGRRNYISSEIAQLVDWRIQCNGERHSLYWAQIAVIIAFHRAHPKNSHIKRLFPSILKTLKPWFRSENFIR